MRPEGLRKVATAALLVCLLTSVAQAAAAQTAQPTTRLGPEPEVPTLWLLDRYDHLTRTTYRFMTIAPAEEWETERLNLWLAGDAAERGIALTEPTTPWVLDEDTTVRVHLWLDFFDQMLPIWEPLDPVGNGDPDNASTTATEDPPPGQTALRVGLRRSAGNEFIGMAEQRWALQELPRGIHEVVFEFPATRSWTWDANETGSGITFWLEWEGARQVDYQSGPEVLYGSAEHPTRVEVTGYPWNATHHAEVAELQAFECRNLAIQGNPCATELSTDDEDDEETRVTPSLHWAFVAATAMAVALCRRRRA